MALVLAAAVAIGTCVIFSVRNVNVSYIGYGEGDVGGTVNEIKGAVLERFRGSLISYVDEEGVKECIDENFVLTGFEKKYPCTVNITVKARREVFAVQDGNSYKTYDEDGVFMRRADGVLNASDNSPNVVLQGVSDDDEIKAAAGVCRLFTENFSSLRSSVEVARVSKAASTVDSDKFIFALRCGLTVEISDYKVLTEDKIIKTAEVFSSLTGEQKLGGAIYCYVTNDGAVRATYNKNG